MIKSILVAASLALLGSAATAQTFSPRGNVGNQAIYDPGTGTFCSSTAPCSIFSGTGGGGATGSTSNATDGQATSTNNQNNVVYNYLFNGTTWDRFRGSSTGLFVQGSTATGATPTENPQLMAGIDQNGKKRPPLTDQTGAFQPPGATPDAGNPLVTLTASTATAVRASAVTGRIGLTVQLETANSAPVYLCYRETTTCSATVHEDMLPTNTAAGTYFVPLYNWNGTIYAYTTATGVQVHYTGWSSN